MSKPIEVGCLVMVVGGSYPEFVGKIGTALKYLPKGERYPLDSSTNLWARGSDCWVVDFAGKIQASVEVTKGSIKNTQSRIIQTMLFQPALLVRINGDDNSLDESECDEISRVKEAV